MGFSHVVGGSQILILLASIYVVVVVLVFLHKESELYVVLSSLSLEGKYQRLPIALFWSSSKRICFPPKREMKIQLDESHALAESLKQEVSQIMIT